MDMYTQTDDDGTLQLAIFKAWIMESINNPNSRVSFDQFIRDRQITDPIVLDTQEFHDPISGVVFVLVTFPDGQELHRFYQSRKQFNAEIEHSIKALQMSYVFAKLENMDVKAWCEHHGKDNKQPTHEAPERFI